MTTAEVAFAGESEPGVRLSVNGGYVPVGDGGAFTVTVQAAPGREHRRRRRGRPGGQPHRAASQLRLPSGRRGDDRARPGDAARRRGSAADARRGGRRRRHRRCRRRRRSSGCSAPTALRSVQTVVSEDGSFRLTAPATPAGADYRLEVVGPDGQVEGTGAFAARQDAEPPEVSFDVPPPTATANAWLEIAGDAPDAVAVTRGRPRRAARRRPLRRGGDASTPGPNVVEIVARGRGRQRDRPPDRDRLRRRSAGDPQRRRRHGRRARTARSRSWSRRATARDCARPRPSS